MPTLPVTAWWEQERLAHLRAYDILDSLPEEAFTDIANLAALLCDMPIAQIGFVDATRQWIKSSVGISVQEVPRQHSFCTHTLETGKSLVIEDASQDARFVRNPFVSGEAHIRCYAGSPIVDRDGHVLGTVCVADTSPHTFSEAQIRGLEALARQVMLLLEQRKHLLEEQQTAQDSRLSSERSLELTAERLRLSQAAGRIASWEWDLATNILRWGGGTEWVYGRPATDLTTLEQVLPLLHPDDTGIVTEALQPALNGTGGYEAEFRVIWPDGTVHWSQAIGEPILSAAGVPIRLIGVHMDITPRKHAEEQLLQSEKIAAVGRLASSIAHELNNPLASVTNLLFLAEMAESLEENREYLQLAKGELDRASAITAQTLRFHKQATLPLRVSLSEVISGVLLLQRSRIQNAGVLLERTDRQPPPILCFEGEIRQVLANLIGNALDAMGSATKRLILRHREGTEWGTGRAGQIITVADNGLGMSRETVDRIFQAFYTTKGVCGTGLGLWVTREIVDRHSGAIRVRSCQRPSRAGSVFRLFLPSAA